MKISILLLLLGTLPAIFFTGCHAERGSAENAMQQLAQIEVYTGDGNLMDTVVDQDILQRFCELDGTDILTNPDDEQSELAEATGNLDILYQIITYKEPAAVINDGSLEELAEMTVYEDSNIIKERIAPENVKVAEIPEEYLTFYRTISDEDMDFILSLAET